jgi:hypothetical protein
MLLSALSSNEQTSLGPNQVEAVAKAAHVNVMFELPKLLDLLRSEKLVEVSKSGSVEVLGVTTETVLQHTDSIFEGLSPCAAEQASLRLAEKVSEAPRYHNETHEYLGDECKLTTQQTASLIENAEQIGFVDFESFGNGDKVYFNGNLFRRDTLSKTTAVLSSLKSTDRQLLLDVEAALKQSGCLALPDVEKMLGKDLLEKLNAIAMFDVSVVNNDQENIAFVTRPAAFSKFGNPLVEDALDLAKAFVSSLTYGMTRSSYVRGQITMIEKLMKKLINGYSVGPVQAIGQDYRALELKRVVEVTPDPAGRGFHMRLLKKEVGEIALRVIKDGDASELSLLSLPGATVTGYVAPEANRERVRRKQQVNSKKTTRDIVMTLRTGGSIE